MNRTYAEPHSRLLFRLGLIGVFLVSLAAIVWRFHGLMPGVFYGDDLDYLLLFKDGDCATDASQILTVACYERFRPVASGFVLMMMNLFQLKLGYYLAVNVALQSLIAYLTFATAMRLSKGNWVASLLIALTVAVSRFATFQVTQMIGPVESLTLALCLGAVYAAVRADESVGAAWKWGWIGIAMAFLAMHSHERSMVVAVWLAMVFVLSPSVRQLSRTRWIALMAACAALPVFYISYKTLVLKAHFMVGTGGTHIKPDPALILEHARFAIRSLYGFNTGQEYLAGVNINFGWHLAGFTAAALLAAWVLLAAAGVGGALADRSATAGRFWERLRWPVLLMALACAMLLPSLLTIRLEQRWLFAPFTMVMLMGAWAVGACRGRMAILATAAVAILACASIAVDTAIMRHYDRIYFISYPRFAELVKEDIIDPKPGAAGPVALIASEDHCAWTLQQGKFFRLYGGKTRKLKCFATVSAAANAELPAGTRLYAAESATEIVDMTGRRETLRAIEAATRYEFLEHFDAGRISDKTHVDTPTGLGALKMPWDSTAGTQATLTVISGYSYSFDDVPVPKDSALSFAVGMVYPSAVPARAVVRIGPSGGGEQQVSFSRDLVPPREGGKPSFEQVSIPLPQFAGKRISVMFAVETPAGSSAGHWVAFSDPRILLVPR